MFIAAMTLQLRDESKREVIAVVDLTLKGMRCRATKEIRSPRGMIKRSTEGTIQHDLENVGRRLISVQWDTGITDYVFPIEVEIITG
jgi:hypothetical protein